MLTQNFNTELKKYTTLSDKSIEMLELICSVEYIDKGVSVIDIGRVPRYYYFVDSGLFSYYFLTETGEKVIKKFFLPNDFIASLSASVQNSSSNFAVEALEKGKLVKVPILEFRKLLSANHDIALFYIEYLERNWVLQKEMLEIVLKFDDAKKRLNDFMMHYPELVKKLKQHQIASYLGITPTQLSRIKKETKPQHM